MADLNDYSDEELRMLLRQADKENRYVERENISSLEMFCGWLNLVGLGQIAEIVKLAVGAWERIRNIWKSIFGGGKEDYEYLSSIIRAARLKSEISRLDDELDGMRTRASIATLILMMILLIGVIGAILIANVVATYGGVLACTVIGLTGVISIFLFVSIVRLDKYQLLKKEIHEKKVELESLENRDRLSK